MQQLLFVGAGGFLGAIGRYLITTLAQRLSPWFGIPLGTLAVNIAGCFLIGLIGGLTEQRFSLSAEARLFLFVGVLGGFTTFSSFGWEAVILARDGAAGRALAYVGLQMILGLGAVWLGLVLSRAN